VIQMDRTGTQRDGTQVDRDTDGQGLVHRRTGTETQTDRQRGRDTDRQEEGEGHRRAERGTGTQTDRERDMKQRRSGTGTEADMDSDRNRGTDRHGHRLTVTQMDRTQRDRKMDTKRHIQGYGHEHRQLYRTAYKKIRALKAVS
jgi:hypothetical protein